MDLSMLSIRELFAELTKTEDALRGVAPDGSAAVGDRPSVVARQEQICRELRSRAARAEPALSGGRRAS
jgi:hypothetical protein